MSFSLFCSRRYNGHCFDDDYDAEDKIAMDWRYKTCIKF